MTRSLPALGAVGGLLGGMAMAMWSMIVMWLTGEGLWTPLNLIAHTFWDGAPTDATFSGGAMVLGAAVHMMMSIIMGLVLALLVYGAKPGPAVLLVGGMMYGIGLWLFNHYAIWTAIDEIAAEAFTPWVFAVGHLMYGVVAAAALLPALGSPAIRERTAA